MPRIRWRDGWRRKPSLQRLVGEVVGGGEGEDALVALDHQGPFEEAAALVVQEIFVPAFLNELGNDDDNAAFGILPGELQNILDDGNDNETVGGRKNFEQRRL